MPDRLFHFTCADHGYKALLKQGRLLPCIQMQLPTKPEIIWLTSNGSATGTSLGLEQKDQTLLRCNRMAYRYVVTDLEHCVPWLESEHRAAEDPTFVEMLEYDRTPDTWWVSPYPVMARLG